MKQRPLGITRENVSALGLGCLQFGSRDDKDLSYSLLNHYFEAGGRFLDTANNYVFWIEGFHGGESERMIGQWMQERGVRDEIFLATKVGAKPRFQGGTFDDAEGLSAEVITRQVEQSLSNLRTDHIDLYYAHIDDRQTPLEETLRAFDHLVRAGKVRHIACSNYKAWRIAEAHRRSEDLGLASYCAVQQWETFLRFRWNSVPPIQEHVSEDLIDYAHTRKNLALITYGPLLWGSYAKPDRPIPDHFKSSENQERLTALYKSAHYLGVSPNQLVLAWLLHQEPVRIPITAAGSVGQLKENLAALELELDESTLNYLDSGH